MNAQPQSRTPTDPRQRGTRAGGAISPHRPNWQQRLGARLVFVFERLLIASLRIEFNDQSALFESEPAQPVIFCIWHNRLALSMAIFRLYTKKKQPARRLAALVSASRDGAFLARILENFGVEPVRGSTSRRGPQALLELTSWAERGHDLAITPDGPRGPRYVLQEGAIALASLTGLPILPVGTRISRKITFKSWDHFQMPLPFARCAVNFGRPFYVARDASDEERQRARIAVQEMMRALGDDSVND